MFRKKEELSEYISAVRPWLAPFASIATMDPDRRVDILNAAFKAMTKYVDADLGSISTPDAPLEEAAKELHAFLFGKELHAVKQDLVAAAEQYLVPFGAKLKEVGFTASQISKGAANGTDWMARFSADYKSTTYDDDKRIVIEYFYRTLGTINTNQLLAEETGLTTAPLSFLFHTMLS